ncbi:MAG: hypothetical protein A2268_10540 [Candidatus Raymondbacteria bacterium RifOxyA12_full_50_37]|uniref:Multidrug resistance protein MdtA-like barrel-sandwich hybrid domain-containing protein n=1 Tax=Candidatus Raymondbacteria bacterium RIFOXYD12_FULL_49_13 TaxID=1817890 RepID=A0A1F7F8X2_UNCRA|nr:MAG: hypothetical protein A2268_10540 [Candidatus Raymondbacteria bacterium RifOxyA12_full_50_37]OGJ85402.1 MAG: hypothetical protein A2248_12325 [Candidatus Raymondbacteria bacterium RIFOXYA2_FULL_49_16]OGJ94910.1 MAG: hypothetical protein A2453_07795 [Candidatus Raymondbacteria bacterium RIFOXYC2_FULL_50_21]OGK03028.1 MAG: hypothetical protein A2519_21280 [Candidatus Raymondbacteria bacterium RIFOXYD12_FULL_49_13]OGP45542.1 MAG: hypothetical protein A2324_04185 [Candidatus Raymondbacteria 
MNIRVYLLLGASLLLSACGSDKTQENLVRKEVVSRVDLRDVIAQTGEVNPVVKVELKSEASGKIDTVYVKEGVRLKKGERILKIDPTQLITKKQKLDLSLEKARLNVTLAKRDYDNAQELFKTGSIAQKKLDDLKNQYELAEIDVKDLTLELDDILYQLSKSLIVSPMDGVLISLDVEEGEIAVSATSGFSGGTTIGTVADISKLEVITQIGEVDYAKIHLGQRVRISLESDSKAQSIGTVSLVSLAAKKESGSTISNFEVRVAIDSLIPGLIPGVNVNSDFIALEKKHVLGVPYTMVEKQKRGDNDIFFVQRPAGSKVALPQGFDKGPDQGQQKPGGRAGGRRGMGDKMDKRMTKVREERTAAIAKLNLVKQRITIGETDYKYYEVLDGLAEGDTVVKIIGGESTER